jgi:hypothetical protein
MTQAWRELRAHFERLLDLAPEARAEALAALGPVLRTELEALLAAAERGDDFLEPRSVAAGPAKDRIGSFRVTSPGDGNGDHWELTARQASGREVALEVWPLGDAPLDSIRRLRTTVRALAFEHASIQRLLEAGITTVPSEPERPALYFAFAHPADTRALRQALGELPPLASARLELFRALASALAAAHARGVPHGALTEARVRVTSEGAPWITGLGPAAVLTPGVSEEDDIARLIALVPTLFAGVRADSSTQARELLALSARTPKRLPSAAELGAALPS